MDVLLTEQTGNYVDLPNRTFLKVDEVARFLKVSNKTVYRWCEEEDLQSVKLNKSLRIFRKSLLKFIEQKQMEEA